ncbi:MAG: hypothetical protein V4555_17020 [Acidobacteriota bacterium]
MKRTTLLLLLATLPLSATAQAPPDPLHTSLNQSLDRLQLGSPSARWSLTAQVQYFDRNKPAEAGTVQLSYAASDQRRTSFDFPSFHQIVTDTAEGHRSEGDSGETPPGLAEVLHFLQDPASRSALSNATLKPLHLKSQGVRLDCIHAIPEPGRHTPTTLLQQTLCTAAGSPALRYAHLESGGYSVFFEKVDTFQGGDVPLIADILFAEIRIARVQFTFAPLTPEQQAAIHPSPASQPISNATLTHTAIKRLNLAAMYPGLHSFVHPTVSIDEDGAAMLLRLHLDPAGKVIDARVIASTDPYNAANFAGNLKGDAFADPYPTSRFANFSFIAKNPEIYGDNFPPIGDNPGSAPSLGGGNTSP